MIAKQQKLKFVFVREDKRLSQKTLVEKNDVGIVESSDEKFLSIYFIRLGIKVKLPRGSVSSLDVERTGDEYKRKICNVCHKILGIALFDKNQNAKNNRSVRRPSCRDCRKLIEGKQVSIKDKKDFHKNNPPKIPFTCPICRKRTIPGITSKVVIDHNHKTGKIRGWICDSCNTGIGRFKDDIKILERAIRYLK